MGSCFSKPDEKHGPSVGKPTTGGNRLGTRHDVNEKHPYEPQAGQKLGTTNKHAGVNKQATGENGKVYAGANEKVSGSVDTKQAAARAAELRFNKHQQDLRQSDAKLKTMAKKSRAEKGLS